MGRKSPGFYDPNSIDYNQDPMADPGHTHSGGGSTFPTFTGSGSPEGSQTATAVNQSYVDSDTGNLWLYNGTPPSDTGWVNQAGGGGSSNSPIVRAFPFTFDTPDLLTGAALYTPTVGDILLDAWIEIDTAWDGTTPTGDLGTFVGTVSGLFDWVVDTTGAVDMTKADIEDAGTGVGLSLQPSLSQMKYGYNIPQIFNAEGPIFPSSLTPIGGMSMMDNGGVPCKFTAANAIKVVVSQDGTNTGADPGSTQGAAILYLVTATPLT